MAFIMRWYPFEKTSFQKDRVELKMVLYNSKKIAYVLGFIVLLRDGIYIIAMYANNFSPHKKTNYDY